MLRTSAALAAAALLAAPVAGQAQEPLQRYLLELRVTDQGRDVAATRTFITEAQAVSLNLIAEGEELSFDAIVSPHQGDGEDTVMSLEVNLLRNGEEVANPRMIFRRSGSALYVVGGENGDGVRIALTPAD